MKCKKAWKWMILTLYPVIMPWYSQRERVEIYHIVEAWIDNFFTGWRSEHSAELRNVATEIAKLSEIAGQKPTKGMYLAAATGAMMFPPTSSSTPSMYKLLKHTAPV
jgi:hypothetical protein